MATPLEILKERRRDNLARLDGLLSGARDAPDQIGRSLVGLGGALFGAFTDPNEKAFKDFQQAQSSGVLSPEGRTNAINQAKGAFSSDMLQSVNQDEVGRGADFSSPEGLRASAFKFQQAGDLNTALRLNNMATKMQQDSQEQFFNLGAGETRFDSNNNVVAEGKPKEVAQKGSVKPLTQAEAFSLGLPTGGVYQRTETGEIKTIYSPKSGQTINVNTGAVTPPTVITPPALLEGFSPPVQRKLDAIYVAGGGGKDSLNAIAKATNDLDEQERRSGSVQMLETLNPNATEDEMAELKSVMAGAKTTESGLESASKLREKQRTRVKGTRFQERSVKLIDRILASPELSDVLGSIQGGIDFTFSDEQASLITDIKEAQDIATADNLDIMTGVLSETDIKIIANLGGGNLNRKRTETAFIKDLTSLKAALSRTINKSSPSNRTTLGTPSSKPVSEMTDEELQAEANN